MSDGSYSKEANLGAGLIGAVEEESPASHTHSGPPHIHSSECLHPASLPMLSITRDTRSWLAGAENCILQPKYVSFS